MLISCPKCRSVYNVSAKRIPENGKKFKCAECGEIWMVYPDSVLDDAPEVEADESEVSEITENVLNNAGQIDKTTDENDINEDINIMFNRLSHNTKNLFASGSSVDDMSIGQKAKHYTLNFISVYMIIAFLLTMAVILGARLIKDYRYDIVSFAPWLESMYSRFKIESIYRGKDIVIKDVNLREISEKGKIYLEVSGRLQNNGKRTVRLLPVKISVINRHNKIEDEVVEILPEHKIEPNFSVLFRVLLDYPSDYKAKIKVTLEDVVQNFND